MHFGRQIVYIDFTGFYSGNYTIQSPIILGGTSNEVLDYKPPPFVH